MYWPSRWPGWLAATRTGMDKKIESGIISEFMNNTCAGNEHTEEGISNTKYSFSALDLKFCVKFA